MTLRTWARKLLSPKLTRPITRPAHLACTELEDRSVPAIHFNVALGGTLDINPVSSIFPGTWPTRMDIELTTVPGTTSGKMYKVSGASVTPWGATTGNLFGPNGTDKRIFSGEGFRYEHTGTVAGASDVIPITFSNGFGNQSDTLVINVVSPSGWPGIATQPQGLTSIATNSSATFSVVATGNGPLSYQWFRGLSPNSQFPILGATSASYTTPPLPASASDYYYWVRVSNSVGSVASMTAAVKVGSAPTAIAGGPYNAIEGGSVQLTGSGSDPNNGLFVLYEWDLDNDGLFGESGSFALNGSENVQNPVYLARDGRAQPWTVKLRTTNDRGLSTTVDATVNVANAPPSNLQFAAPSQVAQGQAFALTGSFADPGVLDNFTVTINWGDGSANTVLNIPAGQNTFSTNKSYDLGYAATGNSTVTITVTDKDGGSLSRTGTIIVTRNNQFRVSVASDENNGTADPAFGAGTSLREAIAYAQANPGLDTITFSSSLNGQTLTLTNGWEGTSDDTALRIFGDVTIDGASQVTLAISSGTKRRHMLTGGGTFTLKNITLRDGDISGAQVGGALIAFGSTFLENVRFTNNKAINGGAVYLVSGGTVTINSSRFDANVSDSLGGAVMSDGSLIVRQSTFNGNSSGFNGGAVRQAGASDISDSTFANNTAVNGGGGLISHGNSTLTNVTIANNTALDGGGVQFFEGTASLRHVTIAYNAATRSGGGIVTNFADVRAVNTIVAANAAPDQPDTWGAAFAAGSANNLVNLSAAGAGIGTLADNGGPTRTVGLNASSPALNAATSLASITTDQRGVIRPQVGSPDIGAYEAQLSEINPPAVTAPDGALWFLFSTVNNERRIYRQALGQNAVEVGGYASSIALQGDGSVVVRQAVGLVYTRLNSANSIGTDWILRPSVQASDSATWFLGTDGPSGQFNIYRWSTAGQFNFTNGWGTRLGVVIGSVVHQNIGGAVYFGVGSASGPINGWNQVNAVAAGDSATWFISAAAGTAGGIFRWAAGGSVQDSSGVGVTLSTTPAGSVRTVTSGGQTYQRVGSTNGLGSDWRLLTESLIVNTLDDENDFTSSVNLGTGTSLREAIAYANANLGPDTITFAPGLNGQTIASAFGWNNSSDDSTFRIFGDLTLDGGNQLTLTTATGNARRLLLSTGGTLTLRNLTIANVDSRGVAEGAALWTNGTVVVDNVRFDGNKAINGGAIQNFGTVTITGSTFQNNLATDSGGAISNGGTLSVSDSLFYLNSAISGGAINTASGLTVSRSTFSTNNAGFNGGALRLFGTASVDSCTFANNTAVNGGGGLISHGNSTLTNVTIANNTALDGGGAQFFEGTATLRHVTVAYNLATRSGGGIVTNFADVSLKSVLVAGNAAPDQNDYWGAAPNAASVGNLMNLSAAAAGLGTLGTNGGPTPTIALLPGSPAVNGGVAIAGLATDQRGLPRISAGLPDVGAVEVPTTAPRVTSFRVLYGNGRSFELIGATRVNLPWAITGIQMTFDQTVTGTAASMGGIAVGGFAGGGTATLTWTLSSPVLTAAIATSLQAAGTNAVRNAWGVALDGTNAGGAGGTPYGRTVRVLAGDFDDNGVVNITDAVLVRNLIVLANPFADANGDGVVDVQDVNFVRGRIGARL